MNKFNEIKKNLNDKFLMKQCNEFTHKALKAGLSINTTCALVKEYQVKYLYIKENDEKLAREFTIEMWVKLRGEN